MAAAASTYGQIYSKKRSNSTETMHFIIFIINFIIIICVLFFFPFRVNLLLLLFSPFFVFVCLYGENLAFTRPFLPFVLINSLTICRTLLLFCINSRIDRMATADYALTLKSVLAAMAGTLLRQEGSSCESIGRRTAVG